MGALTTSLCRRLSLVTRPAQRLQVAVIVSATVSFGFDVVYCRCRYRLSTLNALLADVPVTLQDAGTDDVPLTTVSSLVPALPALMLLPAFIAMIITIAGAIRCCLRTTKFST